jgi:hypothetical protein
MRFISWTILLAACEPEPQPCDYQGQTRCAGTMAELCSEELVWEEDEDCAALGVTCDEVTGRCYTSATF